MITSQQKPLGNGADRTAAQHGRHPRVRGGWPRAGGVRAPAGGRADEQRNGRALWKCEYGRWGWLKRDATAGGCGHLYGRVKCYN